jgi:hypothetical protein
MNQTRSSPPLAPPEDTGGKARRKAGDGVMPLLSHRRAGVLLGYWLWGRGFPPYQAVLTANLDRDLGTDLEGQGAGGWPGRAKKSAPAAPGGTMNQTRSSLPIASPGIGIPGPRHVAIMDDKVRLLVPRLRSGSDCLIVYRGVPNLRSLENSIAAGRVLSGLPLRKVRGRERGNNSLFALFSDWG